MEQRITIKGIPTTLAYADCTGQKRSFAFCYTNLHEGQGVIAEANEITADGQDGYRFKSRVHGSATAAYLELHNVVEEALARRYLVEGEGGEPTMLTQRLAGRIAHDGVFIDGKKLSFETFEKLLTTYEGFHFQIRIKE